jgi:hypothetical protein
VGSYHGRATGNTSVNLLMMALLNNLAHIQMEFHKLLKSGKVIQLLIQYALSIKGRGQHVLSSPKTTYDMIQQANIYILNAMSVFALKPP